MQTRIDRDTTARIHEEVEEAIESLRYSMDIGRDDCTPELAEWEAAKAELRRLMALAYPRNHEIA